VVRGRDVKRVESEIRVCLVILSLICIGFRFLVVGILGRSGGEGKKGKKGRRDSS